MESYRGVYAIKVEKGIIYTRVYVTPENMNIDIDIGETLKRHTAIDFCHKQQGIIAGIDIEGWTGIHIDLEKMEMQIRIYGGCNTPKQTTILEKTVPLPSSNLTIEYDI